MPERRLAGTPASPGVAIGTVWTPIAQAGARGLVAIDDRARERDIALAALAAAADELTAVAARLPAAEGEIVEAGSLMAQDPSLIRTVEEAIASEGLTAGEAILRAAGHHADVIASIGDETLAARADDVRSLGRRAARLTTSERADAPSADNLIVLATDLGPADVAELAPALAGIVLVGGGATAHAAIVARSLGIPMVTGIDGQILESADGTTLVLDGARGTVVLEPSEECEQIARTDMRARGQAAARARELRDQPAVTTDGTAIGVLANVASREELEIALHAGAEGIGLLRTELAFLDAAAWPTEEEHLEALKPILTGLERLPAVVRVLDFGADKSPPFLRGTALRGLDLLLKHPDPFADQLRAILATAQFHDVRILLPMVDTAEQHAQARALIEEAAGTLGIDRIPPIGAMIETPLAAENAFAIARLADFLSIGTNDLTAATLGADRFAANAAHPHHPRVLRSIARSVAAAHDAGLAIEVCGEAASDPVMLPLLVGLGVDEVSVGAARIGEVRGWIRRLSAAEVARLARSALTMDSADEVQWAARQLADRLRACEPATPTSSGEHHSDPASLVVRGS